MGERWELNDVLLVAQVERHSEFLLNDLLSQNIKFYTTDCFGIITSETNLKKL